MSSSTSSTSSRPSPADSHKSDLASALTLALQKRNVEASNTGDDSEKAEAYQAKIDAYKKEKDVPKDPKKMQLEKLMEEFKQKHSKMFNAEEGSSSSSSSSSASSDNSSKDGVGAPKLETFTIPKSQLSQINVIPRKTESPVRSPSIAATGEPASPRKVPLGYTKSQAPAPPNSTSAFASKIVMRSQSSTQKNAPEKRHTVHVSSFKEEDGEGDNTSPLQYWKKKDDAVKKPRAPSAVVVQPSTKANSSTTVTFTSVSPFKKNPLTNTAVEIKSSNSSVPESVSENVPKGPEKVSASDLIKTFNASLSTLTKSSNHGGGGGGGGNVSNYFLNKLKPVPAKPKAPLPGKTAAPAGTLPTFAQTTTIVENTKPVQVNWVPASTNTNRSSHLVKQQSWSERFGGGSNSSIVHISHSSSNQEDSSPEGKSFQKRFTANDNTSTSFKALFNSTQKPQEEKKPLVMIDSYSNSNSRPGPQKIDFLAAPPAAPSLQEEEFEQSDVDEEEEGSIASENAQFQNELSSTLTRSNHRQRYSPDDSSVSSSDSDFDP